MQPPEVPQQSGLLRIQVPPQDRPFLRGHRRAKARQSIDPGVRIAPLALDLLEHPLGEAHLVRQPRDPLAVVAPDNRLLQARNLAGFQTIASGRQTCSSSPNRMSLTKTVRRSAAESPT